MSNKNIFIISLSWPIRLFGFALGKTELISIHTGLPAITTDERDPALGSLHLQFPLLGTTSVMC